jgi:hypothetical protein
VQFFAPVKRRGGEIEPTNLDRLGGLPFGLPATLWPKCKECGGSQSLIAQFAHDQARIDLGRAGRVLFVFQCDHDPGMCESWEKFSGANACLVVEPEQLTNSITPPPDDEPPPNPEWTIVEWQTADDGVPANLKEAALDSAGLESIPDAAWETITADTRLGGIPFWIQSPDEAPRPGWRFVGQVSARDGANFSMDGIAYLFVRDSQPTPEACMFWQCG